MHGRAAPVSVSGGAVGEAFAWKRRSDRGVAACGAGEDGQMKAMVLAAGLGTRLRPLTNDRPKALGEVAGRTLLEITLTRLREFGVREMIVNTHHFSKMIRAYLEANQNFGMRIEI